MGIEWMAKDLDWIQQLVSHFLLNITIYFRDRFLFPQEKRGWENAKHIFFQMFIQPGTSRVCWIVHPLPVGLNLVKHIVAGQGSVNIWCCLSISSLWPISRKLCGHHLTRRDPHWMVMSANPLLFQKSLSFFPQLRYIENLKTVPSKETPVQYAEAEGSLQQIDIKILHLLHM